MTYNQAYYKPEQDNYSYEPYHAQQVRRPFEDQYGQPMPAQQQGGPYEDQYGQPMPAPQPAVGRPSKFNPKYWSRKIWAIVAGAIVIIAVVIGVAVGVTVSNQKKNAYPNYFPQNYTLKDQYGGENFFDNFNYFTGYDPTHGLVHYVPGEQAKALNLTYATADTAVLRVDTSVGPNSVPNASTGRFSVRVESKKTYNNGLFIFNVKHTPYACGAWPALWLVDTSSWPKHGEIDVMESINMGDAGNQMTLHTTDDCSMDVRRKMSYKADNKNCDASKDNNAGCGVTGSKNTFGTQYNDDKGGVVAVEWRDAGIRMWQWAGSSAPADIASKKPTPQNWGLAAADFPSTDCNIGSHFKNQSIVIDIDMCGDLVEASWKDSGCPGMCNTTVANNPDSFKTAYWEFGGFDVYQAS